MITLIYLNGIKKVFLGLDSKYLYLLIYNQSIPYYYNPKMEGRQYFSSSTLMGKEQHKKVTQLLQTLIDSPDSFEFRTPVDYVAYGLLDYPLVIKKPMDLGTVKRNLNNNVYQTVEDCLTDIQLIWDNCKTYNTPQNWIYKQSDKLEKMAKKMVRNYVPFVRMENINDKRRGPHKKEIPLPVGKKSNLKVPQPQQKDYQQKRQGQAEKMDQAPVQSQYSRVRKQFLLFAPLCSPEQIGVIFLLIHKNSPQALQYDEQGGVNVNMDLINDQLVTRLNDQLDMWGIGYAPAKKK